MSLQEVHHGKYPNDGFPKMPEISRSTPINFRAINQVSNQGPNDNPLGIMLSFQLGKAFSIRNINVLKCCFMSSQHTVKAKPQSSKFGILKASIIITPCVYFGGMLSKNLASFLEEWNIFVPDDDDDDD